MSGNRPNDSRNADSQAPHKNTPALQFLQGTIGQVVLPGTAFGLSIGTLGYGFYVGLRASQSKIESQAKQAGKAAKIASTQLSPSQKSQVTRMAARAFVLGSAASVGVFLLAGAGVCAVLGVNTAQAFGDRMDSILRPRVQYMQQYGAISSLRERVSQLRQSTASFAKSTGIRLWQENTDAPGTAEDFNFEWDHEEIDDSSSRARGLGRSNVRLGKISEVSVPGDGERRNLESSRSSQSTEPTHARRRRKVWSGSKRKQGTAPLDADQVTQPNHAGDTAVRE